jgi:hypothetical protein
MGTAGRTRRTEMMGHKRNEDNIEDCKVIIDIISIQE